MLGTDTIEAGDAAYEKKIRSLKTEADDEPFINLQELQAPVKESAKETVKDTLPADTSATVADTAKKAAEADAVKKDSTKKDSTKKN